MRLMHERHVKLMKEMDVNYRLIEEEAQDHIKEFLDKWKFLTKNKIEQYRNAFDSLKGEKEGIQNQTQAIIQASFKMLK